LNGAVPVVIFTSSVAEFQGQIWSSPLINATGKGFTVIITGAVAALHSLPFSELVAVRLNQVVAVRAGGLYPGRFAPVIML